MNLRALHYVAVILRPSATLFLRRKKEWCSSPVKDAWRADWKEGRGKEGGREGPDIRGYTARISREAPREDLKLYDSQNFTTTYTEQPVHKDNDIVVNILVSSIFHHHCSYYEGCCLLLSHSGWGGKNRRRRRRLGLTHCSVFWQSLATWSRGAYYVIK